MAEPPCLLLLLLLLLPPASPAAGQPPVCSLGLRLERDAPGPALGVADGVADALLPRRARRREDAHLQQRRAPAAGARSGPSAGMMLHGDRRCMLPW